MYYVYKFVNKSRKVIYVGKSKQDLSKRFETHHHLPTECYEKTYKIQYIECKTEADMSIKEIFYINKYQNNVPFYNLQDNTDLPLSVSFSDRWKLYEGPLPPRFKNSINYINGFTYPKSEKYNKDGTPNRKVQQNQEIPSKQGISCYVDPLNEDDVNRIIQFMIEEINNATNTHQRQIRFRNLIIFLIGINTPIKIGDLLQLRYKDLYDSNNQPHELKLQLTRAYQDIVISIPLPTHITEILKIYRKYCNLSFDSDSDKQLFVSRKHKLLSTSSLNQILTTPIQALNIKKSIGCESLRKTYGSFIYEKTENKLEALIFLEIISSQTRFSNIIKYYGLLNSEVDINHFFTDQYALGTVDFDTLNSYLYPKPSARLLNYVTHLQTHRYNL